MATVSEAASAVTRARGPLTAVSRSIAMVASSPVSSVNVWTRITPIGVAACPPSVQRVGDGGRDRENPPDQRLRARGREPDDAAGPIDLVPAEAEDLLLAPAGVVGEVEDVLPRGWQVGADGEVFGVLEEALAGRILAEAVGEAGHGVEPAPVDGERAHAMEGRGLPVDGAGGRPGGAPGELILADLVRGERGGPRGAAEERGEMGDPAAGGAVGPELPDLIVLEVGVAEISQGRPLGAKRARRRCRCVGGGGWRASRSRAGSWAGSLWWRPRAGGVRPHSLWWARQARGMCGGEGTARAHARPSQLAKWDHRVPFSGRALEILHDARKRSARDGIGSNGVDQLFGLRKKVEHAWPVIALGSIGEGAAVLGRIVVQRPCPSNSIPDDIHERPPCPDAT